MGVEVFDKALWNQFLDLVEDGIPFRAACKTCGWGKTTVRDWLAEQPVLATQYARAKEELSDAMAEDLLTIADASQHALTSEEVQSAKLRVDARKWIASKLKPKKYGDRTAVEHEGGVSHVHFIAEVPREKSVEDWVKGRQEKDKKP